MNTITRAPAALTAALLFAVLLFAACTGPQSAAVPTTAVPTAAPTAAPTPVIMPEPTSAVIVTVEDLPTFHRTLSEKLHIPLDELRAMSDAQIMALAEQNAAALGLTTGSAEPAAPLDTNAGQPDTGQPDAGRCAAVRLAAGFLAGQYDPAFHLLRESPVTAPDTHWLTTDNALALAALRAAAPCAPDAVSLADDIEQGLAEYGETRHGLIEAVVGGPVEWPPRTAKQTDAAPGVRREERQTGAVMEDWRAYADLSFIGVMHLAQSGRIEDARALYGDTLAMFDGTGFADKANGNGQPYAAYKLALAVLAAAAINEPPDVSVLAQLLDKQDDASGGFFALYDEGGGLNDPNTETTAYSILALMALDNASGNP